MTFHNATKMHVYLFHLSCTPHTEVIKNVLAQTAPQSRDTATKKNRFENDDCFVTHTNGNVMKNKMQ